MKRLLLLLLLCVNFDTVGFAQTYTLKRGGAGFNAPATLNNISIGLGGSSWISAALTDCSATEALSVDLDTSPPTFTCFTPASGGPADAQYVTVALNGSLSAERRLQVSSVFTLSDGGANGDLTLSLTNADRGDITVTDGATWTIDNDVVSYAKMQNVAAASKLLGRGDSGAGDPEEITLGTNLSMTGTTLNATGGGSTPTGTGFVHITAGAQDAASKLVDTADVNTDQITNTLLTNMAQSTIKGRAVGAGTGDPTDLTATEATAVLDAFTSALKGLAPASGGGTTNFLRADGTWTTPGGGSDPWTYVKVAGSDFTTTSGSAVDVTGLAFTPSTNTGYEFEAILMMRTATATVNARVGFAWPSAGVTDGVVMIEQAQAVNTVPLAANGNFNTASLIAVGGLPNTTQSWPVRIQGMIRQGATVTGTVRVQLASETAGTTVTCMIGSFLKYRTIP